MAMVDMMAELTGVLPGLSPILAKKYINRAWEYVRNKRRWAFLQTDAAIVFPVMISAGAANVVQYASTVTLNTAASSAVQAQITGPPTTYPGITNLQIRFGVAAPGTSQIYSIVEVDNTTPTAVVLTLNRMIVEPTNATNPIQIYRAYVQPPVPDFKSWGSIVDMVNGRPITNLGSSQTIDMMDPQRTSYGICYRYGWYEGTYIPDPTTGVVIPNPNTDPGTILYEFWPHSTSGQTLYARIRRAGTDLDLTDELPATVPEAIVVNYAFSAYAYPFAQANVGNFPTFKSVNWPLLLSNARQVFKDEWDIAVRNDDEQARQSIIVQGHGLRSGSVGGYGFGFPVDSNFIQSHLLNV